MTVIVRVGRRIPISFKSRIAQKWGTILGFQDHLWIMIGMSFDKSRKQFQSGKKKPEGRMDKFIIHTEKEKEDEFFKIEWKVITIQGDKKCEEAEYEEAMNMYGAFKDTLKAFPKDAKDPRMASVFKTGILSEDQLKEAYEKGYGAEQNKSIANVLLEMGLLTHIEHIEDYDSSERDMKFDF